MKAIKIDVVNQTITEIELAPGIDAIYQELDCNLFTCISPIGFPPGDAIYIDDEGLLRDPVIGAFSVRGYPQVLSGHGLIIGTDSEGESISCKCILESIKKAIRFEDPHYLPEPGFKIIHF